jgi:hypothetical protein
MEIEVSNAPPRAPILPLTRPIVAQIGRHKEAKVRGCGRMPRHHHAEVDPLGRLREGI